MNLILASASPRRKEILGKYSVKFSVVYSNVDEIKYDFEIAHNMAMRLAFNKSMSVAKDNYNDVIIGADTIVALNDKVLGKPRDKSDAYNMLKSLSGRNHKVITGISLINLSKSIKIVDYEVTEVVFKRLTEQNIIDYLGTEEYYDKAGAYGIQSYGALLVDKIIGDYFNVVGLPISKLSDLLMKNFNINLYSGV